jgi:hypothetical protein
MAKGSNCYMFPMQLEPFDMVPQIYTHRWMFCKNRIRTRGINQSIGWLIPRVVIFILNTRSLCMLSCSDGDWINLSTCNIVLVHFASESNADDIQQIL